MTDEMALLVNISNALEMLGVVIVCCLQVNAIAAFGHLMCSAVSHW